MALYLGSNKVASGVINGNKYVFFNEYSNSEVKTNKVWVNGKPVYRRTWTGLTLPTMDGTWRNLVTYPAESVENVIELSAVLIGADGRKIALPYYETDEYHISLSYQPTANAIQITGVMAGFDQSQIGIICIMEYTKPTDEPASAYVEQLSTRVLDKYVEGEQLVGTWMGKPLYRIVKQYTLVEPEGYPSYPSFDTGARDVEFAMVEAFLTNGDNLQYSRTLGAFNGYLSTNGRYTYILQTPSQYELTATPGLYTFIIHYTKTTD